MHQKLDKFSELAISDNDNPNTKIKQATMVGKCPKMSKELPTSAQPSHAKYQNVILPTHKKKSQQQPPPASWALVCFDTGSCCAIVRQCPTTSTTL
jgi:hypothetical protein